MMEILEINNRNLILYFIISFLFSWILWFPSLFVSIYKLESNLLFDAFQLFGTFGPFVAAFSLTFFNEGLEGVRALWKKGWHCKNKFYLLISIFLIPLLYGISFLLVYIIDNTGLIIQESFSYFLMGFLVIFFFAGPFQEEFGWRGYALDRLQTKFDALTSSIILGALWSLWHFPLFFITGTAQFDQNFVKFFCKVIVLSVLFTWLYNNTNKSVLAVMIFHSMINISSIYFSVINTALGNAIYTNLLNTIVFIVVIVFGTEKLKRKPKMVIKREAILSSIKEPLISV